MLLVEQKFRQLYLKGINFGIKSQDDKSGSQSDDNKFFVKGFT